MVVPFVYTEEEYKKLEREIWKIREVNRENCSLLDEFSEKIRELEKENKKLKGEEIVKKLYTLIDNLTLIADNWIYIYSRDEIREYIEWLILWIQGKSGF